MTLDLDLDDSAPIPLGKGEVEHEPPKDPTTIAAINERFARGAARMNRFETRMGGLETSVKEGVAVSKADHAMTTEVYEIVVMGKRFFGYLGKLGSGIAFLIVWGRKALIWIGTPIAAGIGLWNAVKAALHIGAS